MTETEYKLPGKKPSTLVLIMMISLASVGAALYSPSIPRLDHYFGVSRDIVEWTMTLFLIGYSLGQLIYGPLANRFGRRASLFFGIFFAIIAAILCGLSGPLHSITLLLVMRFILAVASGVGLTVTVTIINDFFFTEQSRKIFPIIAMSFAVMPGVAIFLGGLITYYLSWPDCFYFLAFYYLLALLLVRTLPETLPEKDVNALKLKNLIRDYWPLRKNFELIGYATLVGSSTLFIYVFSAIGPLIAVHTLGLNTALYGVLVLIPSAGLVIGNYVVSTYSKALSIDKFIAISILVMFLGSFALMIVVWTHHLTVTTFFLLISIIYVANPILWNCASVLATANVSNKANGSAILSFINVAGAVIGVFIAGIFANYPEQAMSILFVVVTLFMIVMASYLNVKYRE